MTTEKGDQESPQASTSNEQPSVQSAPPSETPAAIQTRFRVVAAFWAVIIFFGFPIWWKTTSIYRASLPIEEMVDWADGKVRLAQSPLAMRLSRS
jgi:phosphatidylinositol glycan class S